MDIVADYPPVCAVLKTINRFRYKLIYQLDYHEGCNSVVYRVQLPDGRLIALKIQDRERDTWQQPQLDFRQFHRMKDRITLVLDELDFRRFKYQRVPLGPGSSNTLWEGHLGLLLNSLKLPYFLYSYGVFRCGRKDVLLTEYLSSFGNLSRYARRPEHQAGLQLETLVFKVLYALAIAYQQFGFLHGDQPKNVLVVSRREGKGRRVRRNFQVYGRKFLLPVEPVEPVIIDYDSCQLGASAAEIARTKVITRILAVLPTSSPLRQSRYFRDTHKEESFEAVFTSDLFNLFAS